MASANAGDKLKFVYLVPTFRTTDWEYKDNIERRMIT